MLRKKYVLTYFVTVSIKNEDSERDEPVCRCNNYHCCASDDI